MLTIELNLGDTLSCNCTYFDANDAPVNLTTAGITIEAFARNPDGTQEIELDVTLGNQTANPGTFSIYGDTDSWTDQVDTWTLLVRYTGGTAEQPIKYSTERIRVKLL